jgi:hypothetical protein
MTELRDMMNGKVVSYGDDHVIISKDGKQFKIEFDSHNLREISKQQ